LNLQKVLELCHFERREKSDKALISYKIPHIRSGWHSKIRDCRAN